MCCLLCRACFLFCLTFERTKHLTSSPPFQKPNEFLVETEGTSFILSPGLSTGIKTPPSDPEEGGIIMDLPNVSGASPATDALADLLATNDDSVSNDIMSGDTNSLIVDLNDLLKRDPTLSSLSGTSFAVDVEDATSGNATTLGLYGGGGGSGGMTASQGMDIPNSRGHMAGAVVVPNNTPTAAATWTPTAAASIASKPVSMIKMETDLGGGLQQQPQLIQTTTLSFPQQQQQQQQHQQPFQQGQHQPTLAALNHPIKMDTHDLDIDDIDALFMKNSSPNVSFGVGEPKPQLASRDVKPIIASSSNATGVGIVNTAPATTNFNLNFWQADDPGFSGTSNPWSTLNASALSSSVPSTSYNISPLSDILSDLSTSTTNTSASVSPNLPAHSPSQAGPTRHSTLHKLLMRKDPVMSRPSPVRSPEGGGAGVTMPGAAMAAQGSRPVKTLNRMRNSLSASNPILSQQLSASAPGNQSFLSEAAAAAATSGNARIWARREPRHHISSVCSVGEASSLADEVDDVLSRLDPNNLQDIVSDDEDIEEENQGGGGEAITTEDESELEGTSPSTSKLNTSGGSSGKKERFFWQYNVQAKGPKGQKINFETRIDDPHVLNDIVDPVFSGDVQLQGIKHR